MALLAGTHSRERARVRESAPVAPTALWSTSRPWGMGLGRRPSEQPVARARAAHAHHGLAAIRSERPAWARSTDHASRAI